MRGVADQSREEEEWVGGLGVLGRLSEVLWGSTLKKRLLSG